MRLDTPPASPPVQSVVEEEIQEEEDDDMELYEVQSDGEPFDDIDEEDEDIIDQSKLIFDSHTDAVFCAKFSADGKLAVTGGQDDKGIVWDTTSGTELFQCEGHSDSVVEVAFNHFGNYVATADMNGNIKVWNVSTKTLHEEYSTSCETVWMMWHHSANILFVGCKEGDTYVFRIPMTQFKILYGRGLENSCGILMPDGKRVVVGYEGGTVSVWDIKTSSVTQNIKLQHGSVLCLDAYSDNNLIAAGTEKGVVVLIKTNNGQITGTMSCSDGELEVESVKFGFGCTDGILAAGSDRVTFWNIARQSLRSTANLKGDDGVSRMVWATDGTLYVAGNAMGVVYAFDGRTGEQKREYTGHTQMILDISLSADNTNLLTCSNDSTARIFSLKKEESKNE